LLSFGDGDDDDKISWGTTEVPLSTQQSRTMSVAGFSCKLISFMTGMKQR